MSNAADRPHLVKMSKLAMLAEVPAPTIKHYIREGLLPGPAKRTSRNMAYYDARLAERVRTIKELQQRHFLPLRLIGDILEPAPSAKVRADLDAETRASIGSLAQSIQAGHAAMVERRSDRDRAQRREQVLDELQISEDDLALLERLGVLSEEIEGSGGGGLYQGTALELLRVIDETRRVGMGELFPMEILVPYVKTVRELVRVELDLFRQRVLDSELPEGVSVEQVATLAAELGERLLLALRSQMLIVETNELARPWGDGGGSPER